MELLHKTIGQCLGEAAHTYGSRPAFLGEAALSSWEQLERDSDSVARVLLDRGVGHGSHVGLWSEDNAAFVVCFYAVVKIGAVAVLLNTSYKETEAVYALEYADVEFLLIGKGHRDVDYEGICAILMQKRTLPKLREVFSLDPASRRFSTILEETDYATGITDKELAIAKARVKPSDPAAILFTSGTTDRPKGAVLTHYGLVNSAAAMAESTRMTADDRVCVALPLFHCFGLSANLLSCLHSGAAVVFLPSRHARDILGVIKRWHCTVFHAVPTLLLSVAGCPAFHRQSVASLRVGIVGGAGLPPEQYLQLRRKLGMRILSSLGQTEATAGITIIDYDAPDPVGAHTVGRFLPHVEGQIVSIDGHLPLPVGEVGEIRIRGYNVMRGYYRMESGSPAVDMDGWLYTGDLGFVDSDGNLHMAGRCKEIIIRGGENISPLEIEACIASDPRVEEVKCIGIPDPHFGEEVCACVVIRPESAMTAEEVRALVRGNLAYYKTPKYVLFLERFARTGTGKVILSDLRVQVQNELRRLISQ